MPVRTREQLAVAEASRDRAGAGAGRITPGPALHLRDQQQAHRAQAGVTTVARVLASAQRPSPSIRR